MRVCFAVSEVVRTFIYTDMYMCIIILYVSYMHLILQYKMLMVIRCNDISYVHVYFCNDTNRIKCLVAIKS